MNSLDINRSSPRHSHDHSSLPSTAVGSDTKDLKFERPIDRMGVETAHNEHTLVSSSQESSRPSSIPEMETQLRWSKTRTIWQDAFSEFFGVFIMIMFGDGVVAQVVLSGGKKGDYQSISWGWGIAVMLGVYVAGKSGGHLNPAVTLAACVYRKFPWRKFPIYFLAQLLGAMTAAAVVYANYRSAIDVFEGGVGVRTVGLDTSTAGIFCTYPAAFLSKTGMFFSEFICTAVLLFVIYALNDNGAGNLMPLCLFMLIFGIGACFGWETGYAMNLARDFGPRLTSYMIGYGRDVWSAGDYYFWVPMVSPFLGALTGGFLYDVFLYTGNDSPINTPYMGFPRLFQWKRSVWSNTYEAPAKESMV